MRRDKKPRKRRPKVLSGKSGVIYSWTMRQVQDWNNKTVQRIFCCTIIDGTLFWVFSDLVQVAYKSSYSTLNLTVSADNTPCPLLPARVIPRMKGGSGYERLLADTDVPRFFAALRRVQTSGSIGLQPAALIDEFEAFFTNVVGPWLQRQIESGSDVPVTARCSPAQVGRFCGPRLELGNRIHLFEAVEEETVAPLSGAAADVASAQSIPGMTPHEAWLFAATWGSYTQSGDPGACMYGFNEKCRPMSEAHRKDVIHYVLEKCMPCVVEDPGGYDPDELTQLGRFLSYIVTAPLAV